jgi:catechol 2,3-dioxygenase-like lactoylglutathione lyase family enzyme
MPIVYVTNMEASLTWYQQAVPGADLVSSSPYWSELRSEGASLALHVADAVTPGTQLGLAFTADRPLETIVEEWEAGGISPSRGIADEAFGRSVVISDPDGLSIQINEHEPELYP